jgi:hypothetical protein
MPENRTAPGADVSAVAARADAAVPEEHMLEQRG